MGAGMNWKVGIKNGKYGPMGEDLFAQKCMDRHGVKKVERFDLTRDGACPADRPKAERKNKKYIPSCVGATTATIHPFKKPDGYFKCIELADQVFPPPRRPLGQGGSGGSFLVARAAQRRSLYDRPLGLAQSFFAPSRRCLCQSSYPGPRSAT